MAELNQNRAGAQVFAGDLPDKPAPIATEGVGAWMRDNLFKGAWNSALTLAAIALVLYMLPPILNWLIFNANWVGGAEACRANPDGACWPFVTSRWEQFLYGFYEKSERWRIDILLGILAVGIAWMVWEKAPGRKYVALFMLFIYPVLAFFMMYGNETLGLPIVDTPQWGGFTLTLVIALSGIVASLPLGIISIADPNWSIKSVPYTGYVFVGIVFWVCCYAMARYSRHIEEKLHTGHKR